MDHEHRLRAAAMAWLDRFVAGGIEVIRYDERVSVTFEGRRIPLMDPQRGISKPAPLDAALSIRTSYTRPGSHRLTRTPKGRMACSGTCTEDRP